MLTSAYQDAPYHTSNVQALNEFGMFLCTGSIVFSSGFIVEAGGNGLPGWRTILYFVSGLICVFGCAVLYEWRQQQYEKL
mmetsp:Transcript_26915/g.38181  ORF Transcript_26915/g.38181 Transcript_26915/m.38181 type:complete len:80 (-) Transcript_26915:40-279(-)